MAHQMSGLHRARTRQRRAYLVVGLAFVMGLVGCYGDYGVNEFALSLRNESDGPVRLRVYTPSVGPEPAFDIILPAGTDLLNTPTDVMGSRVDNSAEPVSISMFSETCELLTKFTVGERRTLIEVMQDLTVRTTPGQPDDPQIPGPDLAIACKP